MKNRLFTQVKKKKNKKNKKMIINKLIKKLIYKFINIIKILWKS